MLDGKQICHVPVVLLLSHQYAFSSHDQFLENIALTLFKVADVHTNLKRLKTS